MEIIWGIIRGIYIRNNIGNNMGKNKGQIKELYKDIKRYNFIIKYDSYMYFLIFKLIIYELNTDKF
jgi:hypothetical protein